MDCCFGYDYFVWLDGLVFAVADVGCVLMRCWFGCFAFGCLFMSLVVVAVCGCVGYASC